MAKQLAHPPSVAPISFGPPLREWQKRCATIKARFLVMAIHRRAGKTELALKKLLSAANRNKNELPVYFYVAPFFNQAKYIAWKRLKKLISPLVFGGAATVNESELSITLLPNGATIRLFGADNPDAVRGGRLDGVVVDEVSQIKPSLWYDSLRPALSDRRGWAWFIGTPQGINLFSELYYRGASGDYDEWKSARFTVYETEALDIDEVAKLKTELPPQSFAREYLCDFTASADNQLINVTEAEDAASRVIQYGSMDYAPKILGVDPARFGGDRSVIFRRQGLQAFAPKVFQGADNMRLAAAVASEIEAWAPDAVFVDAGAGAGVIDRLRQLGHSVVEVNFGGTAIGNYVNKRAEMWHLMRDWLQMGGAIPNDASLKTELSTPTFDYDATGRIRLESKDSIKKRMPGGASPDLADALALTFAAPVSARAQSQRPDNRPSHTYQREYDPYADI